MRIQHNIAALNSHRQLSNNNTSVSKSLEKLSSGYRINRAGDDAAGLAISEKMRAQITGLETAQKNANDGISLIQTAEGALTEVHSMLNRMVELADQSANGVYDNDTDRKNLQKEMDSLKSEIDRISEGTNFNGINLLDGSLGSSSAKGVAVDVKYGSLASKPGVLDLQQSTQGTASIAAGTATTLSTSAQTTIELTYSDKNGATQKKSIAFTAGSVNATGNDTEIKAAMEEALGDGYTVTVTAGKIDIRSKAAGADKFEIYSVNMKDAGGNKIVGGTGAVTNTAGADAYYNLETGGTNLTGYDGTGNVEDHIFEINGQKFAFATADGAAKLGKDINYVIVAAAGTPDDDELDQMTSLVNNKTGIGATHDTGDTFISLKAGNKAGTAGNGLTLQIGDTADSFNQLTVSIGDMSTKSLGLAGLDISKQEGAKAAIDVIKTAINSVSSTRGDLGALQNRLEHTINNLSVTSENMTAAESRIRDVDMAKEMMTYTKNNILVQSSQAMLAQANQLPQGVLQLLQ